MSTITKLQELKKQRAELEALIASETLAALDDAFKQIDLIVETLSITKEQLAQHFGIGVPEQAPAKASIGGNKRRPVEVKYSFQGVQWTGRGKMPRVYRTALENDSSLSIENFRISK